MLTEKQLELAIKNHRFMARTKVYPNIDKFNTLLGKFAHEYLIFRRYVRAKDKIKECELKGVKATDSVWKMFNTSKAFLNVSMEDYSKAPEPFEIYVMSEEINRETL